MRAFLGALYVVGLFRGARSRARTGTALRSRDFKSLASTNSAIRARLSLAEGSGLAVDPLPELLAGLEKRRLLGGDSDYFATLRVPGFTGLTLPNSEAAKTADFHLFPTLQRIGHGVKDQIDHQFRILAGQEPVNIHKFLDQFALRHCIPLFSNKIMDCMLSLSSFLTTQTSRSFSAHP